MNYCLVNADGNIENIIVLDDITAYTTPSGKTLVIADVGAAIGGTYSNGVFTKPPAPMKTQAQLIDEAQLLINKSDITALRCFKAGIAFPAAWQTYTLALRSIITSGTGTLPVAPAFPAGT